MTVLEVAQFGAVPSLLQRALDQLAVHRNKLLGFLDTRQGLDRIGLHESEGMLRLPFGGELADAREDVASKDRKMS